MPDYHITGPRHDAQLLETHLSYIINTNNLGSNHLMMILREIFVDSFVAFLVTTNELCIQGMSQHAVIQSEVLLNYK